FRVFYYFHLLYILVFFSSLFSYILFFCYILFFFNDPSPTEIYTLSLHDALPISWSNRALGSSGAACRRYMSMLMRCPLGKATTIDRKSTRLNSSHVEISYAVFCLKKKKKKNEEITQVCI